MKIAFLVNEFPSLSETFILNQIVGLVQAGHKVSIYARNPQATSKVHPLLEKYQLTQRTFYQPHLPSNYLVRYIKGFWLLVSHLWKAPSAVIKALSFWKFGRHASSLRLLYRAITFIDQDCPTYDVIMCHFGSIGLIALDLKNIGVLSGKICVTFHGHDLSAYLIEEGEDVYKSLFAQADLLLPISHFWRKRLIELGCNPNKIRVHRMGIDIEQFSLEIREFPRDSQVRLISVARLVEKKGIEYCIWALKEVKEHYPQVEYLVVGDGPLMSEFQNLVHKLKLTDIVKLLGWQQQNEVIRLLSSAHILLAPSITSSNGDMEGIPVALMEAMASGLPVISTQHSGIPELISHGKSGFLVTERDSSELANQILEIIQKPEIWDEIGNTARRKVASEYEVNKLNQQLIDIFECLLSDSHISLDFCQP